MGDENERSMEIESEYEEEEEEKKGEAVEVESEEEEDDEEEEIIEELEEMTSPRISCWLGADGKTYQGVMVVDDDIGNKCQYDDCSICYQPMNIRGKHRLCCLPCGHLYGFSCIKKWLLQSSFSGKCPQCNFICAYKDVVLLHASTLCIHAHQKATSARYFPFTEQGFIEFKEHEWSRHLDAQKRYTDDHMRMVDVVEQQRDLAKQQAAMKPQWDDLVARSVEMNQRAEKLGQRFDELEGADAFKQQIRALTRLNGSLEKRYNALGRHTDALKQRTNVLAQRYNAYEPNLKFFNAMYKEHLAQQKNTEPCAAHTS